MHIRFRLRSIAIADFSFDFFLWYNFHFAEKLEDNNMASMWLSTHPHKRAFTLRLEGRYFHEKIVALSEDFFPRETPNKRTFRRLLHAGNHDDFIFVEFKDKYGMEISEKKIGIESYGDCPFFEY